MATLLYRGGKYSLQFRLRPNEDKKTIALGAMNPATAGVFKRSFEALVDAYRAGESPDRATAKWVREQSDAHHEALARVGLVEPREKPDQGRDIALLGPFLDDYVANREKLLAAGKNKPNTVAILKQVRGCLVEYFGATRPLNAITPGDCDAWRDWMTADKKWAENTVRRRCGVGRQFFRAAVRQRLLTENPFADMAGCSFLENRERDYFVTREEAEKVLEACPDAQWRLLFALSRFGGLRCPSEHLGLRWQDVNWERSKITVRSPKTEAKGKGTRIIPIFSELRPYLEDVLELAKGGSGYVDGNSHVITRYRDCNANLRTQLQRIIRKAGLEPWPKLFQNLRATRATELVAAGWPEYKVCKWLGHTVAVAEKHYWQVTDDDYERAANGNPGALQIARQIPGAMPRDSVNDGIPPDADDPENARDFSGFPSIASYAPLGGIRLAGFEPAAYGLGNRCSIP
jgi:integrase